MIAVHNLKTALQFVQMHRDRGITPKTIPVSQGGWNTIYDELEIRLTIPSKLTVHEQPSWYQIIICGVPLRVMEDSFDIVGYMRANKRR